MDVNVEKVTKTVTVEDEEVVVRLSKEEAEILSAVLFFPRWYMQPVPVQEFCRDLWHGLRSQGVERQAMQLGMTDDTTV